MAQEQDSYDEKLGAILRAAAAVFAEKGYHQATIRDVSRASGVSLSGLYYYVRSKEELLYGIQLHCFTTVLENAERLLEGSDDAEQRLRLLIESHLRYFAANMQEMKVLSHEAESLTGEYRRRVDALKRRYVAIWSETLDRLRPEGSPVDPRVATFALFGMLNWIYNWYRPGRDAGVSGLATDMSRLFLHGYLAAGEAGVRVGRGEGAGVEEGPSIWRH